MSIKISVKEVGVGREVNPYHEFDWGSGDARERFDEAHPELPALDTKGNKLPVGEYEVELVWQYKHVDSKVWSSIKKKYHFRYNGFGDFEQWNNERDFETRQVYIASVEQEETQHEKSLALMKQFVKETPPNGIAELIEQCKYKGVPAIDEAVSTYTENEVISIIEAVKELSAKRQLIRCSEAFDPNCDRKWHVKTSDGKDAVFEIDGGSILAIKPKQFLKKHTAALSASKQPEKEVDTIEQEWIAVDPDLDIYTETNLQHFEQYFIVMAENGKVNQALFCDWDTEGIDNTWIINDVEYPLSFATHYMPVIYPNPPKQLIKPQ